MARAGALCLALLALTCCQVAFGQSFFDLPVNQQAGAVAVDRFIPYTRGGSVNVGPSMSAENMEIDILDFSEAEIEDPVSLTLEGNTKLEAQEIAIGGADMTGAIKLGATVNDFSVNAPNGRILIEAEDIDAFAVIYGDFNANTGEINLVAPNGAVVLDSGTIHFHGDHSDGGTTLTTPAGSNIVFNPEGPSTDPDTNGRLALISDVSTLQGSTVDLNSVTGNVELFADNEADIDGQTVLVDVPEKITVTANSGEVLFEGQTLTVSASNQVTLNGENSVLFNAPRGNIAVNVGGDLELDAGSALNFVGNAEGLSFSGNEIDITAENGINISVEDQFKLSADSIGVTAGGRFVSQSSKTSIESAGDTTFDSGTDTGIRSSGTVLWANQNSATFQSGANFEAESLNEGSFNANILSAGTAGSNAQLVEFKALEEMYLKSTSLQVSAGDLEYDSGRNILFESTNGNVLLAGTDTTKTIHIQGHDSLLLQGQTLDLDSNDGINLKSDDGITAKSTASDVQFTAGTTVDIDISTRADLRAKDWQLQAGQLTLTSTNGDMEMVASDAVQIDATTSATVSGRNVTMSGDDVTFQSTGQNSVSGETGIQILSLGDEHTVSFSSGEASTFQAAADLTLQSNSILTTGSTVIVQPTELLDVDVETATTLSGASFQATSAQTLEFRSRNEVDVDASGNILINAPMGDVDIFAQEAAGNKISLQDDTAVILSAGNDLTWNGERINIQQVGSVATATVQATAGPMTFDAEGKVRFDFGGGIDVESKRDWTTSGLGFSAVANSNIIFTATNANFDINSGAGADIVFESGNDLNFLTAVDFLAKAQYIRLGAVQSATFEGQGATVKAQNAGQDVEIIAGNNVNGAGTGQVSVTGSSVSTSASENINIRGGNILIEQTSATKEVFFESNGGGARFYSGEDMTLKGKSGTSLFHAKILGGITHAAKDGNYVVDGRDISWQGGDIQISTNDTRQTRFETEHAFIVSAGNNEDITVWASDELQGLIDVQTNFDSAGENPVTGNGFFIHTYGAGGGSICHTALKSNGELQFSAVDGIRINSTAGISHSGPNVTFTAQNGLDISTGVGTIGFVSDGFAFDRDLREPFGVYFEASGADGDISFISERADIIQLAEVSILTASNKGTIEMETVKFDARAYDTEAIVNVYALKGNADLTGLKDLYLTAGDPANDGDLNFNATGSVTMDAGTNFNLKQIGASSSSHQQGIDIDAQYGDITIQSANQMSFDSTNRIDMAALNGVMSITTGNQFTLEAERGSVNFASEEVMFFNSKETVSLTSSQDRGGILVASSGTNDLDISAAQGIDAKGAIELNIAGESIVNTANTLAFDSQSLMTLLAGGSVNMQSVDNMLVNSAGNLDLESQDEISFNAPTTIQISANVLNVDAGGDREQSQDGINVASQGKVQFDTTGASSDIGIGANGLVATANALLSFTATNDILRVDVRGDAEDNSNVLFSTTGPQSDIVLTTFDGDIEYDVGIFKASADETIAITSAFVTMESKRRIAFSGQLDNDLGDFSVKAIETITWDAEDVYVVAGRNGAEEAKAGDLTFTSKNDRILVDADAELDLVAQTSVAFLTNGGNNPIEISTLGIDSDILFRSLSTSGDLIIDSAATLTYSGNRQLDIDGEQSVDMQYGANVVFTSPDDQTYAGSSLAYTSVTTTTFISTDDVFVNSLGDVLINSNEISLTSTGKLNFLADTGLTLDTGGATTTEFDISEGDFNVYAGEDISLLSPTGSIEFKNTDTTGGINIVANGRDPDSTYGLKIESTQAQSDITLLTAAGNIEAIAPNGDITIVSAAANTLTAQDSINVEGQGPLGVSIVSGSVNTGYTATASTMSTTAERSIQFIAQQTNIVLTAAADGSIDMASVRDFEMSSTGTFDITSTGTGSVISPNGPIAFHSFGQSGILVDIDSTALATLRATTELFMESPGLVQLTDTSAGGTLMRGRKSLELTALNHNDDTAFDLIGGTLSFDASETRLRSGAGDLTLQATTGTGFNFQYGDRVDFKAEDTLQLLSQGALNFETVAVGTGIELVTDVGSINIKEALTNSVQQTIQFEATSPEGVISLAATSALTIQPQDTGNSQFYMEADHHINLDGLSVMSGGTVLLEAADDVNIAGSALAGADIEFAGATAVTLNTNGPYGDIKATSSGFVGGQSTAAAVRIVAQGTLGATGANLRGLNMPPGSPPENQARLNQHGFELIGNARDVVHRAASIVLHAQQGSVEIRARDDIQYLTTDLGFFGQAVTPIPNPGVLGNADTDYCNDGGNCQCINSAGGDSSDPPGDCSCTVSCPEVTQNIIDINGALLNYSLFQ